MIQRIQSIFLLIVLVLQGLLFILPFSKCVDTVDVETVISGTTFPLIIIQIITFAVTLITIFLYKKRMLQIRFSIFNCIMLLGYQGVAIYMAMGEVCKFSLAITFPIIAAILIFLAIRYIGRDEAMVRSLDRLR